MVCYTIEIKAKAEKELRKLPLPVITKITAEIDNLATEPYPARCKKLAGADCSYRIRVGNYRVIYTVYDTRLVIQVIKIGHRKDVYR